MLYVCFHTKQQPYAIDSQSVVRILPRISVSPIVGSPAWFCGVFSMQGTAVPLVDFCMLSYQVAAQPLFSTRVILLHCHDANGKKQLLGLLTEGVTGTIRYQEDAIHRLDLHLIKAPYLAEVVTDNKGMVQLLNADAFYNVEVADLLENHHKEARIV